MPTATAVQVIAPFRRAVTALVATTKVPTYGWLPDSPAELPCQVVGRPSLRESGTAGVMTATLDVTLLGRRISDEDSQMELDTLADQLFLALGGTKNMRVGELIVRCTLFLPGTVPVAELTYPAYIASVSTETLTC